MMILRTTLYKGYNAVMTRLSALPRLQELAVDQWGLVTRRQMGARGIGPTTVERLAAPGGVLDRVATGVYRLAFTPAPDHLELRAAWLQLAPATAAWDRKGEEGVVSHRSAASMYGLGHLPADRHDFTLSKRRQSRRPDVRIHVRKLDRGEWANLRGLLVTRPSRIASDLLWDHEDPEAVAQIVSDSIRLALDDPGNIADQLAPHAAKFGLRRLDGLGLLRWLLDLTNDPDVGRWMSEARAHDARAPKDGSTS